MAVSSFDAAPVSRLAATAAFLVAATVPLAPHVQKPWSTIDDRRSTRAPAHTRPSRRTSRTPAPGVLVLVLVPSVARNKRFS